MQPFCPVCGWGSRRLSFSLMSFLFSLFMVASISHPLTSPRWRCDFSWVQYNYGLAVDIFSSFLITSSIRGRRLWSPLLVLLMLRFLVCPSFINVMHSRMLNWWSLNYIAGWAMIMLAPVAILSGCAGPLYAWKISLYVWLLFGINYVWICGNWRNVARRIWFDGSIKMLVEVFK